MLQWIYNVFVKIEQKKKHIEFIEAFNILNLSLLKFSSLKLYDGIEACFLNTHGFIF